MKTKIDKQKKLDSLRKKAEALNKNISNIIQIEKDLNGELWKLLENKSSDEYSVIEDELYNFEKLNDRQILILLSRRKQIVKNLSVKNYVKNKQNYEEELSKVREEIRGIED